MTNVNTPFSALPTVTSLSGSEIFPLDQSGTTKTATINQIAQFSSAIIPSAFGKPLATVNDTNVTVSVAGLSTISLVSSLQVSLGWTGTLSSGRLNPNVVQTVSNDTNVTRVISSQNIQLGWTGVLAPSRLDQTGAFAWSGNQTWSASASFNAPVAFSTNVTIADLIVSSAVSISASLAVNSLNVSSATTIGASLTANSITASSAATISASLSANSVTASSAITGNSLGISSVASVGSLIVTGAATTKPSNGIYLSAANTPTITASSLDAVRILPTSSAVNYVTLRGAATGANTLGIGCNGTDTNINFFVDAHGYGSFLQFGLGDGAQSALRVQGPGSPGAVNGFILTAATSGTSPSIAAQDLTGTGDADINLTLVPKGVGQVLTANAMTILNGTAIPAGGTAGSGYKLSTTSNFGIFFGSGVPTLIAAQGSLYLRSDGTSSNTRAYINSSGSSVWQPIITAA